MHPDPQPVPRSLTSAVVLLAAAFAGLVYFGWQYSYIIERHEPHNPVAVFVGRTAMGVLWLFSIPLVLAAANRWPISPGRRLRHALVLAGSGLGFAAVRAIVDHGIWWIVIGGRPASNFWPTVLLLFHSELLVLGALVVVANYVRIERENAARRALEARLRAALTQARVRKLRADLDPHFLFNALNAVAALIGNDPAAAARVMRELIELLRDSLATQDSATVPLSHELAFVQRYLAIQQARFGPCLTTGISLSDPRLASAQLPPLLIQPLVENSIVHGLGNCRDGGMVIVEVSAVGDMLRLLVRDDGPGCPIEANRASGSVGIPNARERLRCLYGDRQSLSFYRVQAEFITEVRLPLQWSHSS